MRCGNGFSFSDDFVKPNLGVALQRVVTAAYDQHAS